MGERDEDARRWAPPGHPAARGEAEARRARADEPSASGAEEQQPSASAAAPWTRDVLRPRASTEASAVPASELTPPTVPWIAPPEEAAAARREPSMLPIAVGLALLAALAWVPHWVAPTIAIMVALVGLPIAWGFRRISHGRRRVQYVVVVLALALIAALSVIAPMTWLELGVLEPLALPD
ncbi:hypothetical protein [Agrococcus sp. Marseille-P2731]|uniref:hypothetical protein n=1 Tax=Agrococcus sp. Marseille-P2731 TaxID=1841862 RepID=UPI000930BF25|nr:hypothetical protein [Agrococcus sp. Marseille-P2731]